MATSILVSPSIPPSCTEDTLIFYDRVILSSRDFKFERFYDEISELRTAISPYCCLFDGVRNTVFVHTVDFTSENLRRISFRDLAMNIPKLHVGVPVILLHDYYPKEGP